MLSTHNPDLICRFVNSPGTSLKVSKGPLKVNESFFTWEVCTAIASHVVRRHQKKSCTLNTSRLVATGDKKKRCEAVCLCYVSFDSRKITLKVSILPLRIISLGVNSAFFFSNRWYKVQVFMLNKPRCSFSYPVYSFISQQTLIMYWLLVCSSLIKT